MRVDLKGIHSSIKKLSDGTKRTYYYAWRGGPRLEGEPGSREFSASFQKAAADHREKGLADKANVSFLVDRYLDSQDYLKLAPRTRSDYRKIADVITTKFGDLAIAALAIKRVRVNFLDWRDELAKASPRQADYAWTVLARIFSWSVARGHIDHNPCTKGGRIYDGNRAENVWLPEHEKAFLEKASPAITLAMTLALWTGQRQGDLLALTWFAYDGECLRLRQSKTGVRVTIPVGGPLKVLLDARRGDAPKDGKILLNSAGEPWTADGFRVSWRKTCIRAKVTGLTFHDLRGTAVTHLFAAQCSEAEVATITGHSLQDVQSILDANYFSRDIGLARSGIAKLEASRALKTGLQKAGNPLIDIGAKIAPFVGKGE